VFSENELSSYKELKGLYPDLPETPSRQGLSTLFQSNSELATQVRDTCRMTIRQTNALCFDALEKMKDTSEFQEMQTCTEVLAEVLRTTFSNNKGLDARDIMDWAIYLSNCGFVPNKNTLRM